MIHVWFVVEDGAKGMTAQCAAVRRRLGESRSGQGQLGSRPVPGLERQPGDLLVEKMRMSAWQDTNLESLLRGLDRDQVIVTGAWTNLSIEHTARSGADKGYSMFVPEDCCSTMNADWHRLRLIRDAKRRRRDKSKRSYRGAPLARQRESPRWVNARCTAERLADPGACAVQRGNSRSMSKSITARVPKSNTRGEAGRRRYSVHRSPTVPHLLFVHHLPEFAACLFTRSRHILDRMHVGSVTCRAPDMSEGKFKWWRTAN